MNVSVIIFKIKLKEKKELLSFEEIFNEVKLGIADQLAKSKAIISEDFSQCTKIEYPPLHLKRIMQNLITNAVKYKQTHKQLNIEVKTSQHNGRICFHVSDNGIGFNGTKYSGKMFRLFGRLHNHIDGQGVGLYIVKSIVDAHGGEIEVFSKPNEGSLFNIHLNSAKNEKSVISRR